MSAAGGAGPAGLQWCVFGKAESGLVCLGGEPVILRCILEWDGTIVTQDS